MLKKHFVYQYDNYTMNRVIKLHPKSDKNELSQNG